MFSYREEPGWWQIYMIHIDNHGQKSKFYGKTKIYYTGITTNIGRRFGDYLFHRGKTYVNKYWRNAAKIPVYIEYLYGDELMAMKREKEIKRLKTEQKKELIASKKNQFIYYKLLDSIIIRNREGTCDEIIKII